MRFHEDGTLPQNGEIFVFGSNQAGLHGAGAAQVAHDKFGARWGKGFGLTGQSYAIPTKDWCIQTLALDEIQQYVSFFLRYKFEHPEARFFVTRIGCGLAGYQDRQIAPMFKHAPHNCSFAQQWRQYLE